MSVIPTIYNQGTGLIGSATEGASIPSTVEDLVVQNTLTVIGTTNLVADVTCDATLTAETLAATTLQVDDVIIDDLFVQNATVQDTATVETLITQELGGSNTTTFSLPVNIGTDGQVLCILNDSDTPPTTEWKDDVAVDNYVSYESISDQLQTNVGGTTSTITDLNIDTVNATTVDSTLITSDSLTVGSQLPTLGADVVFVRSDVVNGVSKTQTFQFNDPNTANAGIRLGVVPPQTIVDFQQGIEMDAVDDEIRLTNKSNAITQEVNVKTSGVYLTSTGGAAANNGIYFTTGNGLIVKFPQNTPSNGDTMRIQPGGSGTNQNPYVLAWQV
jgi:hypothetical protein